MRTPIFCISCSARGLNTYVTNGLSRSKGGVSFLVEQGMIGVTHAGTCLQ